MRLLTICMVTFLSAASAGIATASPINLVKNGDFSQIHKAGSLTVVHGTPTQLNYTPLFPLSYGEFVNDWTTTGPQLSQHVVWFPSAAAASSTKAEDIDAAVAGIPLRPLLPDSVTAPPSSTTFLGMQSNLYNSGVQQTINGLSPGQTYTVSFDWAATQDRIDTGKLTSSFNVLLDNNLSYTTGSQTVRSNKGLFGAHTPATFNGWLSESFDFMADSASETLKFLSNGTPSSLPPFALLSNVSMTEVPHAVPEPASLGLFGGGLGLLGLGLLSRRRAMRRRSGGDKG